MKSPPPSVENDRPLIYVADDDPSLRLPMAEILTAEGFEVEVFEGAAQLLERCKARLPDLLLLDVEMPGLDGFGVCSQLRSDSRSALLPIVMITGHDDGASIHRAYVAGATDFMAKPVNWPLLGYRLRYVLRTAKSKLELIARENENRALLEAIPDAILVVHRDGSIVGQLRGMEDNADLSRTIATELSDVSRGFQDSGLLASVRRVALRQHLEMLELRVERAEAEAQIFELRCSPLNDEEVLVIARNISERKAAEKRIYRLAYFDALTGLPNREKFQEDLDRRLLTVDGKPAQVATLYLDLDRFKRINDTFGHAIGDGLLRATADRLSRICRNDDGCSVARLGGDEFAVLVEDVADTARLIVIAERILQAFSEPMSSAGHEFVMTPSIGIAQFPQHAGDSGTLLKNADTAMYAAKAQGRNNYAIYQPAMNARSAAAVELENLLRKAIERDEILVAYQPKRRAIDGELVGVEALARWYDPERGLIPASQFIPIAEDTGLISRVGRAVLQQVVRQLSLWRERGRLAVPVAVNICAVEFGRGEVAGFVKELLDAYQLPAELLQFEITEGVLLLATPTVTRSIAALRELGCRISIDDFGTGYSSLAYLQNLQIDALKIDQSFVRRLPDEEAAVAICNAVIALAKGLKLEVVAEGVETDAQLAFLRESGCDTIQGYLVGRPMLAGEFESLLMTQAAGIPQAKRA